jgi:peptidoglycan/LPS O-acetylase OafA/YrhL
VSASPSSPRFPLVDSLRAIAALCVFAVHLPFWVRLDAGNPLKPYLLQLNVGVSVFFLVSGFLLYRPFAAARRAGAPRPPLVPYALRRVFRIVPAYWVALPFVVLLVGASGEAASATPVFSPRGIVAYFGFLQAYSSQTLLGGISAAWTLCAEAAFYAFLPLWAWALRRVAVRSAAGFLRTELFALGGLFAVGLVYTLIAAAHTTIDARVFVDVTRVEPWLYLLPAFLDQFALGMALAVVSIAVTERDVAPAAVRLVDRAPWVPWLVAALAFLLLGRVVDWVPGDFGRQFVLIHLCQGVVALGLLMPAVLGRPDRGWVRRVLANRALLWIGLVSYSLYLWHAAILRVLADADLDRTLGGIGYTVLGLGVSLLVAGASFYAIERPALRVGRRLSRRRDAQDADVRMRALERHEAPGVPPG